MLLKVKISKLLIYCIHFYLMRIKVNLNQNPKNLQVKLLSPYVEEYRTRDGIITIYLDERNEKYFKNINKLLDKVNYNLKMLNHNMNVVCELIKILQKNFEVLYVLNIRVVMKPNKLKHMKKK